MRGLPTALVVLLSLSSPNVAFAITGSACRSLANQHSTQVPVTAPMNQPTYLCSNQVATGPQRIGDLSPNGQMQNTQVCDSSCSYQPLFADDPDSPLIPVDCGHPNNFNHPYEVNGSAASQTASQGPPAPYLGAGGNCEPLMIPQAPININGKGKAPTVKSVKPGGSPAPSPSPSTPPKG